MGAYICLLACLSVLIETHRVMNEPSSNILCAWVGPGQRKQ